jgi:DNA-directed RNA polymerase specialized sigma24 family protein
MDVVSYLATLGTLSLLAMYLMTNVAAIRFLRYRMPGSLHEADDALQETLSRAWRAIERFEPRASLSTW